MSNDNFKEVYTNDDKWIKLRYVWDPELEYYIIYDAKDSESTINRQFMNDIKYDGPYKFVDVSAGIITFVNNYGVKCTVDPTNESTRENVKIFSGLKGMNILIRETWFQISYVPFDKQFFKLGHCYMVKETKVADYKPMMLIEMTHAEMHFISVSRPDHFKDPGISHYYIKRNDYLRRKNKSCWFIALMEGDVWSDHKGMTEEATDGQFTKNEEESK
jgi:hypothetical protein